MSFISICWLIVKICAIIIAIFLALGFIAKAIYNKRAGKDLENDKRFSTHD